MKQSEYRISALKEIEELRREHVMPLKGYWIWANKAKKHQKRQIKPDLKSLM